ncbi:sialate O-acetylesterase [Bdellovibrio bacteriovorus]|uniref:sialate O-acetylesterase n=1 Tax=Bdellovibrio bacteriovorus TaxID=959 RepID=UPI0012F9E2AC|nr:sialate O-acetylesterase [Bdellovibrio bacteriovorus]
MTLPALSAEEGFKGYDILVLGGQSNAAGWGIGEQAADSPSLDHKIFQWDWQNSKIADQPAQEPIKSPAQTNPRKIRGFVLPFAKIYSEKALAPGRALLIINGAVGGSNITEWHSEKAYYQQLISAAQKVLQQPGLENKVVGILWHQGEADIKLAATDPQWKARSVLYQSQLQEVVHAFQKDLTNRNAETPVFIAGEMSREWMDHSLIKDHYVNGMHRSLKNLEKTGFVDSAGLAGNPKDKIHFDGPSQALLGLRYFKKFNDLTQIVPSCKNVF